jgi:hypothetical protein
MSNEIKSILTPRNPGEEDSLTRARYPVKGFTPSEMAKMVKLSEAPSATYGQPLSECTDVAILRSQVEHLYQLLDDIDTASDALKPHLAQPLSLDNYYRFTQNRQQRKNERLVSDGYKLYLLMPASGQAEAGSLAEK